MIRTSCYPIHVQRDPAAASASVTDPSEARVDQPAATEALGGAAWVYTGLDYVGNGAGGHWYEHGRV